MAVLFVSMDNGALYSQIDDIEDGSEYFWRLEVPEVITLTPQDLTKGDGSVAEMLVQSGKARRTQ